MRNLGFSRSGVARPREAFWAGTNCCGRFSSEEDRAITLPPAAPSELHLTPQPRRRWLSRGAAETQSCRWGEPRDRDVAADLMCGLKRQRERGRGGRDEQLCGQNISSTADLILRRCATRLRCRRSKRCKHARWSALRKPTSRRRGVEISQPSLRRYLWPRVHKVNV